MDFKIYFIKIFKRLCILYKIAEIIDGLNKYLKNDLNDLLNQPLNEENKKIKLLELVKNGSIKNYCGRLTGEKINKISESVIENYH